jgi:hypothetical protein
MSNDHQREGSAPKFAADDSSEASRVSQRARRKLLHPRDHGVPVAQVFDTVESAAVKLGLDANALRARCRRAAQRVGDAIVAQLGGGIVAFKFGKSWRVRFPSST